MNKAEKKEVQAVVNQVVDELESGDWVPDNCPPAVVRLIENEQYLEDLKLRGLASNDSAEFHQAVRRLRAHLGAAFNAGKAAKSKLPTISYAAGYLVVGYVAGALSGALLVLYFLP